MENLKSKLLANLSTEEAIRQVKLESTPMRRLEHEDDKMCKVEAGKNVLDDWGDTCEGSPCQLTKGHSGRHMATDGANGWVTFK